MNQSDKLLAITTQLMDPIKLRSTDVIVTQDGQIKNLAGQDISMQVYDEKFVVNIATIGSIDIGLTDSFELEQIEATGNMQAAINNKNIVLYIPEPTDSIIETNTVENKKILINGDKILNLNDGTIADGVTIILSANKIEGLSTRDVMMGEQKVGQLIISRKDTWILENAQINKNISNPEYDQKEMFAGSSTNGGK